MRRTGVGEQRYADVTVVCSTIAPRWQCHKLWSVRSATSSTIEAATDICRSLEGRDFGKVHLVDAACRYEEALDGARLYFDLTLADPVAGEDTWPVEDLLQLQTELDELAGARQLDVPWQVSVGRQSAEQYDEDPPSEG